MSTLQIIEKHGARVLESPRLARIGVPHAWALREVQGPPPGASVTSRPPDFSVNLRQARKAIGNHRDRLKPVTLRQVHGSIVHHAREAYRDPDSKSPPLEGDALIAGGPSDGGYLLVMRMADCATVLISDTTGRHVAAVHAGWRGTVAGVLPGTIAALCDACGVTADKLVVAIGPCIALPRFEIGAEVADAFEKAGLAFAVHHDPTLGRKPHADIAEALVHQAETAGVSRDAIDTCALCTHRDADLFYSHRRDGDPRRMHAVIAPIELDACKRGEAGKGGG